MKPFILLTLLSLAVPGFSQTGYVKLDNDSVFAGYIRRYVAIAGADNGYEIWKTKNDKHPRRFSIRDIREYVIKKDTFRVFHNFQPFHDHDMYYEVLEVKAEQRGKVDLYSILTKNAQPMSTPGGLSVMIRLPDKKIGKSLILFFLENPQTGFVRGLPVDGEELKEALRDFFPDRYIERYEQEKGKIAYKSVPGLVRLYNSR